MAAAATVLLPLLAGVLAALLGDRARGWIAGAGALATGLAALAVAAAVQGGGVPPHPVGGWPAPLGIALVADGLAAVMLVTVAVVGVAVVAHVSWLPLPAHQARAFVPLWLLGWAALDALVLSGDVFNLYVTLELLTLAAVGLVVLADAPDARAGGVRYLLLAFAGSLPYLLGVVLLYGAYGALDLSLLSRRIEPGVVASVALALMTAGLALKTALFPLHAWLPPAHGSALPPVSALLSALVVKGSFVVLVRLWTELVPPAGALALGDALGLLGAGAVLFGSVLAIRQTRLKRLIAYSTVAQVGYLFLLFPLAGELGTAGGVLLVISHAAAKASLFLAAGTIVAAAGSDELSALPGLARHLPFTFFAIALAGVSLMGMPPSGGFIGKWLLLRAALEGGWGWAVVILAGGLLAAVYVFRLVRLAFLAPPPGLSLLPVARRAQLATLALALVAVGLGLAPALPLELLGLEVTR